MDGFVWTEHGEHEKSSIHNVGESIYFLVVARIVAQGIYELGENQ